MTVGLDKGAAAIGVGALIERIDGSQNGSAVLVDQIDSTKVPAGVAHGYFAEVTIPAGISNRTPSTEIVPSL